MSDIAVPRETLERWRYTLEDNVAHPEVNELNRRVVLFEIKNTLLSYGPEKADAAPTLQDMRGSVRVDVDAIPELVTRDEVKRMIDDALQAHTCVTYTTP